MRIQQSSHQGCVVLTLAGRLDLAAAPQVQREILKQLAQQPPAIICDLAQVEAIDSLCAGVFVSIRHPALGWPATALVLCGVRPAVAAILVRHGVMPHLAMYPSLDQALANARARPPRLGARLTLGPVPTAAAAGRQFVGEVCGHWGLQVLAEPAALLASELVTNAVVHAHTALELRVELRGSRLQVAVHDQDPNLLGLLAAKDGTGRGLGLQIVDQVAKAWGVRQDGARGKSVWFTLDLPPPQADTTTTPGSVWRAAAGSGRVAWVSLDEGDNDPTRFWNYVVEAFRTVEPSVGTTALMALQRRSVEIRRVVLPSLLNDLGEIGSPLVLVLDDYHLLTNASCHQTLGFFLDHLPAGIHVLLSTRADPPLSLDSQGRGDLPAARALTEQARELIDRFADPGSLPALLERAERVLRPAPHQRAEIVAPLTERERAVLRLLPTRLSHREIGRELYVSVNTVKSQVQAIYRKFEVTSRAEAVAHARHLRLLPGSTTPTDP
jgi:anti-anti-sigma factor